VNTETGERQERPEAGFGFNKKAESGWLPASNPTRNIHGNVTDISETEKLSVTSHQTQVV
jgi:hypothetical protein